MNINVGCESIVDDGWMILSDEKAVERFSSTFATKVQHMVESVTNVPWWHHEGDASCSCGGRIVCGEEQLKSCKAGYGVCVWIFVNAGVRRYVLKEWKRKKRQAFREVERRLPRVVLLEMMKYHESQGMLYALEVFRQDMMMI